MTAVVHNNSTYVGQAVTVSFNVLDEKGTLLKTASQVEAFYRPSADHALGTQVSLDPGQKAAKVEASLDVEANGAFSDKAFPAAPTGPVTVRTGEYGQTVASFELSNPLTVALKSPRVAVVCTNPSGAIVGGGSSYPELVPASGKVKVDTDVLVSGKPSTCSPYVGPDVSWDGEGTPPAEASSSAAAPQAATGSAEAAFKKWVERFNAKDWAAQYDTLVSAQRAVVSKDEYVACRSKTTAPEFKWLKVLSVTDGRADVIPGTNASLPSTKVTVQVAVQGAKVPVTAHMYQEDGQWRWSMTQENISNCA
ncbi:hypothetical protein [Humibacillus xanthopallidus]|uniref:hypothetical protein n=1 Tax=Humibacillus xanthopallidus TaxID=412689 RepID=UPI003850AEC4